MSKLHYLVLLAGLPVAALVAWRLGGAVGGGALFGAVAALCISLAGALWSERAQRRQSKLALEAFVLTFLGKLVALTAGALLLRFVPELGSRLDWSAYLLGFAAAVVWSMLAGTLSHWRSIHPARS